MRAATRFFAALLLGATVTPALADSTVIYGNVTTERLPHDFSDTSGTDWGVGLTHTFDNNFVIALAGKYYDVARTTDYKVNLDASVGYTHNFGAFSLTFMAGAGQHFIDAVRSWSFPYYFFSGSADIPITKQLTWTAIKLRYRNAFDNSNNYNTPEVATGISYWVSEQTAITLVVERDWTHGLPAYDGIELGFKHKF